MFDVGLSKCKIWSDSCFPFFWMDDFCSITFFLCLREMIVVGIVGVPSSMFMMPLGSGSTAIHVDGF